MEYSNGNIENLIDEFFASKEHGYTVNQVIGLQESYVDKQFYEEIGCEIPNVKELLIEFRAFLIERNSNK